MNFSSGMRVNQDERSLQANLPKQELNKSQKIIKQKNDFQLTQEQRLCIQHYLPKGFSLIRFSNSNQRSNYASRALFEQSLTFMDRKRGRPEGSLKKSQTKKLGERQSLRIADNPNGRYNIRHHNSRHNFEQSQQNSNQSFKDSEFNKNWPSESVNLLRQTSNHSEDMFESMEIKLEQRTKNSKKAKLEKTSDIQKRQDRQKQDEKQLNKETISNKMQQKQSKLKELNQKQNNNEIDKNNDKINYLQKNVTFQNQQEKYKFIYQRVILRKLKNHKKILPFIEPVDQIRDKAPGYFQKIRNPIDLSTIQFKLNNNIYKQKDQFHDDIRLMWANSKIYNIKNQFMQNATKQLEIYYLSLLSKQAKAIKKNINKK